MTYFGFLLRFLGVPLLLLCLLLARDWRSGRRLPDALRQMPAWLSAGAAGLIRVSSIIALLRNLGAGFRRNSLVARSYT
jgi:hypothetical protein